jgi:hypothetical protein
MIIGTFQVSPSGKKKKNGKLERHKQLYHSGFYLHDSKGNFVKNDKDLARKDQFACAFCGKVIGPQELIDNVKNRFIQVPEGPLKRKPAHKECFDLAVVGGEMRDREDEKVSGDEMYDV